MLSTLFSIKIFDCLSFDHSLEVLWLARNQIEFLSNPFNDNIMSLWLKSRFVYSRKCDWWCKFVVLRWHYTLIWNVTFVYHKFSFLMYYFNWNHQQIWTVPGAECSILISTIAVSLHVLLFAFVSRNYTNPAEAVSWTILKFNINAHVLFPQNRLPVFLRTVFNDH